MLGSHRDARKDRRQEQWWKRTSSHVILVCSFTLPSENPSHTLVQLREEYLPISTFMRPPKLIEKRGS